MRHLQNEVRNAFKSYDEIDAASTASLKYLHAVALEGMRLYPPLPFALPRVVPHGGDTVDGHFLPGGVSARVDEKHLLTIDRCRPLFQQTRLQRAFRLKTLTILGNSIHSGG